MVSKEFAKYLEPLLFPVKLYSLAYSDEVKSVYWSSNGTTVKLDTDNLSRECFRPEIFNVADHKHVFRQLSYYGFRRIKKVGNVWEFHHPHFLANRFDLVKTIRRAGKKNRNLVKTEDIDPDFYFAERRKSSRLQSKESCSYFWDTPDVKDEPLFDKSQSVIESKPNIRRGRKRKQNCCKESTKKPRLSKTRNSPSTYLPEHSTSGKDLSFLKATLYDAKPSPSPKVRTRSKPRRQGRRKQRARNSKKPACPSVGKDPSYHATTEIKDENNESERTVMKKYDVNNNQFRFHGDNNIPGTNSILIKTEQDALIDKPIHISNPATGYNASDCEIVYVSEAPSLPADCGTTCSDESLMKVITLLNSPNDHNYSVLDRSTVSSLDLEEFEREPLPTDKSKVNVNASSLMPATEIKNEEISKTRKNGAFFVLGSNYSWKPVEETKNLNTSETRKLLEDLSTKNVAGITLSEKKSKTRDERKDFETVSRQINIGQPFYCSINDVFRNGIKEEPNQTNQTSTSQYLNSTKDQSGMQTLYEPTNAEVAARNLSVGYENASIGKEQNFLDASKLTTKTGDTSKARSGGVKLEKDSSVTHKETRLSKSINFDDIFTSSNYFIGGYCLRDRSKVKKELENSNQSDYDQHLEKRRARPTNIQTSHARGRKRYTTPATSNQFDVAPVQPVSNSKFQLLQPMQIHTAKPGTLAETSERSVKQSTAKETFRANGDIYSFISNTPSNRGTGMRQPMSNDTYRGNEDTSSYTNRTAANTNCSIRPHSSKDTYRADGYTGSYTNHTAASTHNGIKRYTSKETYRANGDTCSYTKDTAGSTDNDIGRLASNETYRADGYTGAYTNRTAASTHNGMKRLTSKETYRENGDICSYTDNASGSTDNGMRRLTSNETYRAEEDISCYANHSATSVGKVMKRLPSKETYRANGDICSYTNRTATSTDNGMRRHKSKGSYRPNGNIFSGNYTASGTDNGVRQRTSKETCRANGDICSNTIHIAGSTDNGMRRNLTNETYRPNGDIRSYTNHTATSTENGMRRHKSKEIYRSNGNICSDTNYAASGIDNGMRQHTSRENYRPNEDMPSNTIHTAGSTDNAMRRNTPNETYLIDGDIFFNASQTSASIGSVVKRQCAPKDIPMTFLTFEEALCSLHLPPENLIENQEPSGGQSCLTLLSPEKLIKQDEVHINDTCRKLMVEYLYNQFISGELCSWDLFESSDPVIRSCAYDALTFSFESI